jgi:endonuclease G, mitochondrial
MIDLEQLIKKTERRFAERQSFREASREKLKAGKILEVDTPDRIQKRFGRLHINEGAARAIMASGLSLGNISTPGTAPAADPMVLERIMGTNDLMGIFFLELGLRISRSVCRISVRQANGSLLGYGTGFLVSPRLLLTNNHVLGTAGESSHSVLEFNYQVGFKGQMNTSALFPLAPQDFFLTDARLDYTLVAVQGEANGNTLASFGWNRLIAETGKAIIGEYLNIIQHPNGEPKQLALRENELIDVLDNFLHYHTDTAPGSSGSPVFNDQWEVVALHHSGVPKRDANGKILTRDNKIWEPWMGEHRIDWLANEGIRISKILEHLQSQPLSHEQRLFRDEMIALDPPIEVGRTVPQPAPTMPQVLLDEKEGSATWTIPVQLTVRLGQTGALLPVTGSATSPKPPAQVEQPQPLITPGQDQELREALAELESSRTLPYYDNEKDLADRSAYYSELPENQSPQELFRTLNRLISETHAQKPGYKPSKHVYPWVDLHPDRQLRSIYSGRAYDPEEFIREDFRISLERTNKLRELMAVERFLETSAKVRGIIVLKYCKKQFNILKYRANLRLTIQIGGRRCWENNRDRWALGTWRPRGGCRKDTF